MIRRTLLLILVSVAVAGLSCKRAETPVQPNLLLITLDTTRPDHTTPYGYERDTTPHLAALAARSVRFTNAVAQIPLTDPSHMTLLTGRRPYRTGVEENGFELPESEVTLAEILRDRGYSTAAFVSVRHLGTQGFDQGFATYVWPKDVHQLKAHITLNRALAWLDTASPEPFFLWVHFFDPHMDYNAPEPFKRKYGDDPVGRYDGEIAYTDDSVGRLIGKLDDLDLADRTAIVVASDHGENLLDRKSAPNKPDYRFHHGHSVGDFEIRTLLTMRLPGTRSAGKTIDGSAELTDVLPTVLDYLGIPKPGGVELDGVSFLSAIRGSSAPPRRYAFSYTNWNRAPWLCVRTPTAKLVRDIRDGSDVITRLDGPGEAPVETARELTAAMDAWAAEKHVITENRKAPKTTENPAIIENLKALGYLDASPAENSDEPETDPKH